MIQRSNIKRAAARLHFWFVNARPVSLPQSVLPALVGLLLAWSGHAAGFSLALGLVALLGAELAHLSFNLFDDYFDYRKIKAGYREKLATQGMRARTSKCPYLISGAATMRELLAACCGFGAAAVACGFIVWLGRGNIILWPAGLCLALGLMYSGDPLRLSYRGLGEAVIGVVFGPLLVCGMYVAAAGEFALQALTVGLSLGLLVTNILFVHSVLDLPADLYAGKRTLAALLKTPSRNMAALAVLTFLPYGLIIVSIMLGWLPPLWLLTLLTLPLALALYQSMRDFRKQPKARPQRLFWYGPMGDWQKICAGGLDWFMLRWFLARNLLSAFAVCGGLAAIFG